MNPETDDLGVESFEDVSEKFYSQDKPMDERAGRQIARVGARAAETIGGLPGDVVSIARSLVSGLPGGLAKEEDLNFVQRAGKRALESLPTSSDIRAQVAERRPELEPQSEGEETMDEFVSDFASLAIPFKGKIPFARALGISGIGAIGKSAAKDMGLGEKGQNVTKLGLMIFSSMFGKGRGVNKYISNLYKDAGKSFPKGASFQYPMKQLNAVEQQMMKGDLNDAKKPVVEIIDRIKGKMSNGSLTIEEAMQFDKDINRAIAKSSKDRSLSGNLKQLKSAHSKFFDEYSKENPTFGKYWSDAKQAYQGIATSQQAQDFIRRNANLSNFVHGAALLGLADYAFPGNRKQSATGLAGTAAATYAAVLAKRFGTNPALRRYYMNVLDAALSENKASLARNMAGLERVAKKEFEKEPFPTVEFEEEEVED